MTRRKPGVGRRTLGWLVATTAAAESVGATIYSFAHHDLAGVIVFGSVAAFVFSLGAFVEKVKGLVEG